MWSLSERIEHRWTDVNPHTRKTSFCGRTYVTVTPDVTASLSELVVNHEYDWDYVSGFDGMQSKLCRAVAFSLSDSQAHKLRTEVDEPMARLLYSAVACERQPFEVFASEMFGTVRDNHLVLTVPVECMVTDAYDNPCDSCLVFHAAKLSHARVSIDSIDISMGGLRCYHFNVVLCKAQIKTYHEPL